MVLLDSQGSAEGLRRTKFGLHYKVFESVVATFADVPEDRNENNRGKENNGSNHAVWYWKPYERYRLGSLHKPHSIVDLLVCRGELFGCIVSVND